MQGVLTAQHQLNPAANVVIRADKNTEYSNIADLMAACANAGIGTVTFAVSIGGNNNKQASAMGGGTASN
jgi:biopolymer transport protein ExbD